MFVCLPPRHTLMMLLLPRRIAIDTPCLRYATHTLFITLRRFRFFLCCHDADAVAASCRRHAIFTYVAAAAALFADGAMPLPMLFDAATMLMPLIDAPCRCRKAMLFAPLPMPRYTRAAD